MIETPAQGVCNRSSALHLDHVPHFLSPMQHIVLRLACINLAMFSLSRIKTQIKAVCVVVLTQPQEARWLSQHICLSAGSRELVVLVSASSGLAPVLRRGSVFFLFCRPMALDKLYSLVNLSSPQTLGVCSLLVLIGSCSHV